jgi:hypothetical protein
MVDGLKPAVTPEGRPLAVRAMALLNPPETAVVTVDVPLDPGLTATEVGLAIKVKVGPTVSDTGAVWVTPPPLPEMSTE